MTKYLLVALLSALPVLAQASVPFWGDKTSQPIGVTAEQLKPGQWVWDPDAAPAGPIVVVVDLGDQIGHVYRNGVEVGYSSVSTGRKGYRTPTGVFVTLMKDKDHHSSIYNNAAMPYTQRLTWGGVSLHAGGLPGYPSSHGCVHLPSAFAEALFAASPLGMTVVVADDSSAPVDVAHASVMAPVDAKGAALETSRLAAGETSRWEPEKAPEGPVSLLLSGKDLRVLVYRNGVEIGRSRIEVVNPEVPLGSHVFVVAQPRAGDDPKQGPRWIAHGVPGHTAKDQVPMDPAQRARVRIPPEFIAEAQPLLVPGSSLMITDAAVLPETSGVAMTVISNQPPEN